MGYFDLYHAARTQHGFGSQVNALKRELQTLERRSPTPKVLHRRQELMIDFLKLCDFNPGFLVPYFFPRYPENKPLSLLRRPFAFAMYNFMPAGYTAIRGSRQISKCRSIRDTASVWDKHGQPLRPDELQVGREILSVDSLCQRTTSKITAIHQAGHLEVFRVTMRSGRSLLLSRDHGLRKLDGWESVDQLRVGDRVASMRLGGLFGQHREDRIRIILTAYMLGDGSCVSGNFNFTSECRPALDEFQWLAETLQDIPVRRHRKPGSAAWSVSLSRHKSSRFRAWLEQDGTWGCHAWEKKIPGWVYKLSMEDTRLFLSRLWATDGSVAQSQDACPQITFSVTSERLAEGVQSLLCKFGIETTITSGTGAVDGVEKRQFHRVRVKGRPSWERFVKLFPDIPGKPVNAITIPETVSNNNDDVLPKEIHSTLGGIGKACQNLPGAAFKPNGLAIKRAYCPNREKLERYLKHGEEHVPDNPDVAELRHWLYAADVAWTQVKSIERVGLEPCWDIEVEDTHTYVVDGIVSHNSTSFAGRQLINAQLLPRWNSMHVTPHTDHRATYGTRLREMEMAGRFYKKRHDLRQNLYLKEFITGSKIELVRALTSAAHIRGKSTDELLYDEYQLFDVSLEGEIDQTIKASKAKVRIYAGTSTTIDSPLEDRFQASSQGYWHLRGSRGWINFGDKDQSIKMIRPEGLRDPWDSTKMVDVRNGQWVYAYPERLDMHQVGFHIPQLIIPDLIEDIEQWADIYRAFVDYDLKLFLQEVLGIPVEEGSREITQKDLERICVLGDPDDPVANSREYCQAKAKRGEYKFVISGFDWGGSDHQADTSIKTSFTAHVMLGITYDLKFEIILMKKYAGMNYRDIVGRILHDHFEHNGMAIASDHGGGSVYNQVVREDKRVDIERHLVMNYTGPNTAVFTAPRIKDPMYNQWSVNRTESISALFEAIKDPEMPLKCYGWELARPFLLDFMNSFRVVSESMHGQRYFKYIRPPSKPDDIMHAMNFAFVLGKVLIGKPIIQDPGLARKLSDRLRIRVGVRPGGAHKPHSTSFGGRVLMG